MAVRTNTLLQLLEDLRTTCDEAVFTTDTYVTKAEATRYLNKAAQSFSLRYRAFGVLVKYTSFSVSAGFVSTDLPDDFAALNWATFAWQGQQRPMFRASTEEIALAPGSDIAGTISGGPTGVQTWAAGRPLYAVDGDTFLYTNPGDTYVVTLSYVPELPCYDGTTNLAKAELSADTDYIRVRTAIDEWMVLDSAIRIYRKQDKDPSLFIAGRQDIEEALVDSIVDRDAMHAPTVTNAWDRGRFQPRDRW
jgi:hypothetical protein